MAIEVLRVACSVFGWVGVGLCVGYLFWILGEEDGDE